MYKNKSIQQKLVGMVLHLGMSGEVRMASTTSTQKLTFKPSILGLNVDPATNV